MYPKKSGAEEESLTLPWKKVTEVLVQGKGLGAHLQRIMYELRSGHRHRRKAPWCWGFGSFLLPTCCLTLVRLYPFPGVSLFLAEDPCTR